MEPDTPKVPGNGALVRGLPPVAPPSGRFIAQLFLVPGMIVALAVLILLGFRFLVGGNQTPDYFLRQLDSANADIRWRGASDLAQVLKRPESVDLRSDPAFALDLADRLRAALDELYHAEKANHERVRSLSPKDQELAWRLWSDSHRPHVKYLAAALGDFTIAAGVPLLCELAGRADSPDVNGNTLQRRAAVWALGNLGDNRKGFEQLPSAKQANIRQYLAEQAKGDGNRSVWARNALYYLDKKQTAIIPPGVVEVDRVLARCANAEDRFLRRQVALVLYFWDGPLAEETLLRLAADDGHGTLIEPPENP